jgi:hypothetical protein
MTQHWKKFDGDFWVCRICGIEYDPYFVMPHDKIDMGIDPLNDPLDERTYCYECLKTESEVRLKRGKKAKGRLMKLISTRDVTCKSCVFYHEERCRRYPRSRITHEEYWCGEFVGHSNMHGFMEQLRLYLEQEKEST